MFMRQLTYLIALDKHRHFGRAAESCHVSGLTYDDAVLKKEYLEKIPAHGDLR